MSHCLLFDERDMYFLRRSFALGKNDRDLFDLVEPGDAVLMYFDGGLNDRLHRDEYSSPSGRSHDRSVRALCRVAGRNLPGSNETGLEPQDLYLHCWMLNPPIPVSREVAKRMRSELLDEGPFDLNGNVKDRYLYRFSLSGLGGLDLRSSFERPSWAEELLREAASSPNFALLTARGPTKSASANAAEPSTTGGVSTSSPSVEQRAVARMATTARHTAAGANGQQVLRTVKKKELLFEDDQELERYIGEVIAHQKGQCAVTGLPLQFDDTHDDPELLCSLDRIDSSRHYERGNLQIVCRFINRWKNDGDDKEFRRLINLVQGIHGGR